MKFIFARGYLCSSELPEKPSRMGKLRRTLRMALAAAVLCGVSPAYADPPDPLARHMRLLGVALEATTLGGAQRILGEAEISQNGGDAGAAATAECYAGRDGTTLALVSSDEMDGGTTISIFQLVAREELAEYSMDYRYIVPSSMRPRCAPLRALSRSTATDGGLHLGMTKSQVRRLLGEPSSATEESLTFRSAHKVRLSLEQKKALEANGSNELLAGPFVRGRWLTVEFEGGKAVAIRASQGTSN
jgi:hypothetical protein